MVFKNRVVSVMVLLTLVMAVNAANYGLSREVQGLVPSFGSKLGSVNVQSVTYPEGDYFAGERVSIKVKLVNSKNIASRVLVTWKILSTDNNGVAKVNKSVNLEAGETKWAVLEWEIPNALVSGSYLSKLEVIVPPEFFEDLPMVIYGFDKKLPSKLFSIFKAQDDFETLDSVFWKKSTHNLGRSTLTPEIVRAENGLLKMMMKSSHLLDGGEIQSREPMSYGLYETRMKLPSAPSSITGFFLYSPPDFYYEVDIELVNDGCGTYYLTTYAEGKVSHTYEGKLGFDPTKAYHQYKIDYQLKSISFYIDDKMVKRWSENLPHKPMHLMLNVWYPTWLEGLPPLNDTELSVDWVRY